MEFETFEKEREGCRVKSKDDLRLGEKMRRDIIRSLVVVETSISSGGSFSAGGFASLSPTTTLSKSLPTNGSGCEGSGSDNDENEHSSEHRVCCAVYSQGELRRAERKLTRERSTNRKQCRRMNRGFFRPLTPEEKCIANTNCEHTAVDSKILDSENANIGVIAGGDQHEVGRSPMMELELEGSASMEDMCDNNMVISPTKSPPPGAALLS